MVMLWQGFEELVEGDGHDVLIQVVGRALSRSGE